MLLIVRWAVLAASLTLSVIDGAAAQPVGGTSQDATAGGRVFAEKGCVKCHSLRGVGGKIGPDLARVSRPHSFHELAAAMWNHLPRMAERMKQLGIDRPKLDDRETRDLIAFLYTLNYFDPPGNRESGRKLFVEKKCVACHQVGGAGGAGGPPLDSMKVFASPILVATALWNHGPQMAEAMKEKGIDRPSFTGAELRDLIAYLAPATGGPPQGPVYAVPGRVETGRLLFAEKQCVQCHSAGGVGGPGGPDLVERNVRRSPVEFAAAMWNKGPAMMVAMQQRGITVPTLKPDEMADIVAYLYSVRYFASGNISRGWRVAYEKGCLVCHSVFGERGKPAGDLTRYQGLDSPPAVIAALWNHTLVPPPAPGGKKAPWPSFKPAEMADLVALLQSLTRREPSASR
jgi:mono/diheme cytochrome c family protein